MITPDVRWHDTDDDHPHRGLQLRHDAAAGDDGHHLHHHRHPDQHVYNGLPAVTSV